MPQTNNHTSKNNDIQQATYSIGVAARMTGISAHKLRMWERRYKLAPSKRSESGQREFTRTDIDHLKLLKRLTDKGMRIGDVARLPMKTLSSLLLEADTSTLIPEQARHHSAQVLGASLCDYFRHHKQRYPNLQFELLEELPQNYLNTVSQQELLPDFSLLQLDTLTPIHITPLNKMVAKGSHIIIFYHYATREVREELAQANITLVEGGVAASRIDETLSKTLSLKEHMSVLEQNNHRFNIASATSYPRQYSEQDLVDASNQADKLHCECPPHLVDLITRLNAFEDYSKNCESDNWRQAAVHACIYSYTNQARFLIEKALTAVLNE